MKKITFLDPADFCGGAELSLLDLAQELAPFSDLTVLENGKITRDFPPSVRVKTMDFPRLRPFRIALFFQKIRELRAFLADHPPDILHTNSVRAGFFAVFSGVKKWTHFAHDATTPRFFAPFLARADCLFACSEFVKKDLISKGIPAQKIQVVFNGISLPPIFQKPQNLRRKIAMIGRIDPWKGHAIFLKVAEKMPECDFLIFGNSDAHDAKTVAHEQHLRALAPPNVRFCGFENREKIFSCIDATLHLSTETEPFGRVIAESLAFGVPVFATTNEILQGDILDWFNISPENPERIAEKIRHFFVDLPLQRDFEKAARQRAYDFERGKWAKKIAETWENL